jgi:hypothetical protein
MLLGPVFGPVVRQDIIVGSNWGGNLFTSWQLGSEESQKKDPGSQYPLQGHTPNDLTSFH